MPPLYLSNGCYCHLSPCHQCQFFPSLRRPPQAGSHERGFCPRARAAELARRSVRERVRGNKRRPFLSSKGYVCQRRSAKACAFARQFSKNNKGVPALFIKWLLLSPKPINANFSRPCGDRRRRAPMDIGLCPRARAINRSRLRSAIGSKTDFHFIEVDILSKKCYYKFVYADFVVLRKRGISK